MNKNNLIKCCCLIGLTKVIMASVTEKRRVRSPPNKKKGKSAVIDSPVSDPHIKEFVDKTYAKKKQIFDKLAKL